MTQMLLQQQDTFSVYRLKKGEETMLLRFEPYERLLTAGLKVRQANYDRIYTARLKPGTTLKDIYERFNIDRPKDFTGHSLSVSDVIVLYQNGRCTAYYVDSPGVHKVPEFLQTEAIFDLQRIINYLRVVHNKVVNADSDKKISEAVYQVAIDRLDNLNMKIPQEQVQLREIISFVFKSPDLPTLKDRITVVINFVNIEVRDENSK